MKVGLLIPPSVSDPEIALRELVGLARAFRPDVEPELISLHLPADGARQLAAAAGLGSVIILSKALNGQEAASSDNLVAAATLACATSDVVFLPSGAGSEEAAARLAFRLEAAFVGNCVAVEIEQNSPMFVRPICGGRAIETLKARAARIVVTAARKRFPQTKGASAECRLRELDSSHLNLRTSEVATRESLTGDGARRLTESTIVVAGGRGLGNRESFGAVNELALALGGAVGASRAAVDAGWASHSIQVGQTGNVIAPEVYIAVGISGAPQHVAGIAGAKLVVAINSDEQAPIFQWAHLGIVDDYRAILPELIDALHKTVPETETV